MNLAFTNIRLSKTFEPFDQSLLNRNSLNLNLSKNIGTRNLLKPTLVWTRLSIFLYEILTFGIYALTYASSVIESYLIYQI